MTMVTTCDNKLCQYRDKPCRVGCLQDGTANYCAFCDNSVCPITCPVIKVPVYRCTKGVST